MGQSAEKPTKPDPIRKLDIYGGPQPPFSTSRSAAYFLCQIRVRDSTSLEEIANKVERCVLTNEPLRSKARSIGLRFVPWDHTGCDVSAKVGYAGTKITEACRQEVKSLTGRVKYGDVEHYGRDVHATVVDNELSASGSSSVNLHGETTETIVRRYKQCVIVPNRRKVPAVILDPY